MTIRGWAHVTAGLVAAIYGVLMTAFANASRAYVAGRDYTYHESLLSGGRVQIALLATTLAVYAVTYGAIVGIARMARWRLRQSR